jgi:cystathionine beta-lyase
VRLDRHQKSALELARWLAQRPEVARVIHPALPEDPGYALWKRDFSGASGLFSVILNPFSRQSVAAMLDGLSLFGMGYSWGGFESLIIPFDPRDYRTATTWNAEGPALRLHVGLEDVEDLKADLDAGFARLNARA